MNHHNEMHFKYAQMNTRVTLYKTREFDVDLKSKMTLTILLEIADLFVFT